MKRFVALLVAVVMVLVAVGVRSVIDGDGRSGSDGGGGGGADGSGGSGDLGLICGPELLGACNAIAEDSDGISVRIEPEQETADRMTSGDLTLSGNQVWLAAGDWPAITSAGLGSGGDDVESLALASSDVLARSPAVIVGRTERMDAATGTCGTLDWSCLGDAAGSPWTGLGGEPGWGEVKLGLPDVDAAPGMVAVNQALASRIGTSEFASNDLAEPQVAGWFERLARESGRTASSLEPLAELIRVQGSLSMAGALESDAIRELRPAASAGSFTVTAPEPVATADVRLWAPSEQAVDDAIDRLEVERLSTALSRTGWRVPDGSGDLSAPPGAASIGADMTSLDTALPDSSGLPSPGTVFTVNTRWRDSQ